jgi:hypothetical protein
MLMHAYACGPSRGIPMTRIFVPFNLKTGADKGAYEDWANITKSPSVRASSSITAFDAFDGTGLCGSSAKLPCEYVEAADVADMGAFGEDVARGTMLRVAAESAPIAEPVFHLSRPLHG